MKKELGESLIPDIRKRLTIKESLLIIAILVVGIIIYRLTLATALTPDEVIIEPLTTEERCSLVVKTTGKDYMLSEPSYGIYIYELYVSSDGWTEVWKCK